jgi:hypothetical protein
MTSEESIKQLVDSIKLPEQNISELAFCKDARVSSVVEWAGALPATRISNTSVMLYQALPELVRLEVAPADRLKMLEALRPYVQQCVQGLAQNFLNQPLILPEGAMKTAVIAQALQKHMSNGYLVVFKQLVLKNLGKKIKNQDQADLSLSLHRAITGCGLQFLRSAQLYTATPAQLWHEMNSLYLLAEELGLLKLSCQDHMLKQLKANTIEQSYIRTLMLASARPNQLRQSELLALYDALEEWSTKIHLAEIDENTKNLFLINLGSNHGPEYKSRSSESVSGLLRELDLTPIVVALERHEESSGDNTFITVPKGLPSSVVTQVCESWGIARQRSSKRIANHSVLDIVIGLSSIHFHLSDETPFTSFVFPKQDEHAVKRSINFETHNLSRDNDVWGSAPDAESQHRGLVSLDYAVEKPQDEIDHKQKYPIFQTVTADASPEGYCLAWRDAIPANAKVGEILGVREQSRNKWSIGVIRWVRQHKGSSQLGVLMLAPQARPYALKKVHTTGEHGDFMRALLIPEFKATKAPASLILPLLPFRAGDKAIKNNHGAEETTFLIKRLFHTSAINQFSFRLLDNNPDKPPAGIEEDRNFADDW